MASGREVDTKTKSIAGIAGWHNKTAVEAADWSGSSGAWKDEKEEDSARRKQNCPLIVTLIETYDVNHKTLVQEEHQKALDDLTRQFEERLRQKENEIEELKKQIKINEV